MLLAQDFNAIETQAGVKSPSSLGVFITTAIPYIYYIVGSLLLIYLVLGGLQLMLSRGDPKAVQGAWAKITNALIGFVVIVISYSLILLLGKVLGISPFSQVFQ